MDIKITYDVNDVAQEIKREVTEQLQTDLKRATDDLRKQFISGAQNLVNELAGLMSMQDGKLKARVERVIVKNLDRWLK